MGIYSTHHLGIIRVYALLYETGPCVRHSDWPGGWLGRGSQRGSGWGGMGVENLARRRQPMSSQEPAPATKRGQRLRYARERHCLTQEQLAECIGTTRLSVSRWENDVARPSLFFQRKLCEYFGLSPEELGFAPTRSRSSSSQPSAGPSTAAVSGSFSAGGLLIKLPLLPMPPTGLLGRGAEMKQAHELLCDAGVRLLTLCGAPGVGKTRLGLQVISDVRDHFADGVCFVSLAPVRDSSLVARSIASALGLREPDSACQLDVLLAALRDKNVLLLLDNFEHLVAAAPLVSDLLSACLGLTIVVTSRSALHLRGEREFPVEPLTLPDPVPHLPPIEALAQVPSVALFLQRAQGIAPDFTLTPANARAVATICRRLDGLPLAIELAAARTRLFTPETLLARLEQRLPLLAGGAPQLPERQQTLRNTLDWSYRLLPLWQQALFRRLAVFVGGCTLDGIDAVCAAPDAVDRSQIDGVCALLDHHLLYRDAGGLDDAETRVSMLETIREYAHELLAASGEAAITERRHAAYFLALAEAAEAQLRGPEQRIWAGRLEREHDNLRAALRWALKEGEVEIGLRLGNALWWFWLMHGHLSEGLQWIKQMLANARPSEIACSAATSAESEVLELVALRATALHGAGTLAQYQGEYAQARRLLEQSLALRRTLGDSTGVASTSNNLAIVLQYLGEFASAATLYEESLAIKRQSKNLHGIATTLSNLATMRARLGDWVGAAPLFEESLERWRALGDRQNVARTLANWGEAIHHRGDHQQAAAMVAEGVAELRDLEDKRGLAHALRILGDVHGALGKASSALDLYSEALALHRLVGDRGNMVIALEAVAAFWCAERRFERAARTLAVASSLRDALALPLSPASRHGVEKSRTAVQTVLGDDAFAICWEQGRTMALEEAIANAVEDGSSGVPHLRASGGVRAATLPSRPNGMHD